MFITKMSLPRRTFLRGIGATMALPLLDAMVPALTAAGQTAASPVRRFGAIYVPHGAILNQWTPATAGAGFEFTPILKPLEPFRDQLCVVSGLDGPTGSRPRGGHAIAPAMWLSGVTPKKTEGADVRTGTTIDQMIAKQIGQDTPFPSLEVATEDFTGFVGACDIGYSCTYMNTISWQAPTRRCRWRSTRGSSSSGCSAAPAPPSSGSRACARDRSILDSVTESATRLQTGLGARGPTAARRVSGEHPRDRAADPAGREACAARWSVPEAPIGVPDAFEEHVALMFDLLAVAYQADITRVFTFMMARESASRPTRRSASPSRITRCRTTRTSRRRSARFAKVNTYHMQPVRPVPREAALDARRRRLAAGSLDDPLRQRHEQRQRAQSRGAAAPGGRRRIGRSGGRHLKAPDDDPIGNLLLSVAEKFGLALDSVGDSTGTHRSVRREGGPSVRSRHSDRVDRAWRCAGAVSLGRRHRPPVSSTRSSRATVRPCAPCSSSAPTSIAPEVDGTTALHWAVRADEREMVDAADSRRRQGEGGEPLRRHAALAGRHQRQRPRDRSAARGRGGSERHPARGGDGADDRGARRAAPTP